MQKDESVNSNMLELQDATNVGDLESVIALTNLICQSDDNAGDRRFCAEVLIEVNHEARYGHSGQWVGKLHIQDQCAQKNCGPAERVTVGHTIDHGRQQ